MSFAAAMLSIVRERERQDEMWGEQNHPDGTGRFLAKHALWARQATERATEDGSLTWRHILWEEVGEAFAESDPVALRKELAQVAAVALAWIEAIDRRST